MEIQHSIQEKPRRTSLRARIDAQRRYPTKILHRTVRHLTVHAAPITPTRDQKNLILTGLVLGCVSIITFFFPVCALLAALTGLLLGLYGRRATSLERMATWTIILSLLGLVLAGINFIMLVSTYIGRYSLS